MTTREEIIAAAKEVEPGFNPEEAHPLFTSLVGFSEVERFYAIAFEAGASSRDAEIADLKRELDNEQARDIHSCHPNCSREGCVNRRLRAELASKQAKIDALMLEYCPDEMTEEQLHVWGEHQRKSKAEQS